MTLSIESTNYFIHFDQYGYQQLNHFLAEQLYSKIFILVDINTNEVCLPVFLPNLETETAIEIIEIESGESSKNIETCVEIWNVLTELGADRKSLIINVGGGVVTDLGGFIASTFKRGIDFINVPTSLLAMVDASVGGKTGIDLGNLKNQIGVINNPKMVVIDTEFLNTLPQNQMRSGLAEMLKHGLIADKNYWEKFLNLSELDFADFDQLIHHSIIIKNKIVTQDPTENGIRKALNFGHTLGHAIESYFLENDEKPELLHGEAVAAGMILESHISLQKNLISNEEYVQIKNAIQSVFENISFNDKDQSAIMDLMIHDKKNEFGQVQFVLLDGIGNIKINQKVENKTITEAFEDYNS